MIAWYILEVPRVPGDKCYVCVCVCVCVCARAHSVIIDSLPFRVIDNFNRPVIPAGMIVVAILHVQHLTARWLRYRCLVLVMNSDTCTS